MQSNAYFEQAFAAAEGDEVVLKRLCVARGGLDRQIAENYILLQMQAEYEGLEWNIDQRALLERTVATLEEQIELKGGSYLFDIHNSLNKYKLDLRLLTGTEETEPEETVEETESSTEEAVVPETTEPVVDNNTENNNTLWIGIGIAAVVIAVAGVVVIRKKSKK